MTTSDLLQLCLRLVLIPIPLKLCSEELLVRWGKSWNPTALELWRWAAKPGVNCSVRYDPSRSANREKNVVLLCRGKGDGIHGFIQGWQSRHQVGI